MSAWWSYALAPFGLAGMLLAGRRNAWGWALSFTTQGLWLAYAITTHQWGFIPGTIGYATIYARNFRAWRKDNTVTDQTTPEPLPVREPGDTFRQPAATTLPPATPDGWNDPWTRPTAWAAFGSDKDK